MEMEVSRAIKVEGRPYHSVVTATVVVVVGEEKRMMGEEDPERV